MLVSREQSGNAIGRALRLFVGRGRHYSVKELSNGTGVKDRMIECAMIEPDNIDFRPLPADALISIAKFLGAAFTNAWLKLADQVAVDAADLNLDDLANRAGDFVLTYTQARHHDSEAGIDIGPGEHSALGEKAAVLRLAS